MSELTKVTWKPGLRIPQDPDVEEVYRLDWSDWLKGEALASVTYEISPAGELTVEREQLATSHEDVRVAGGVAGNRYAVTFKARSSSGRGRDRTVYWQILEQ